MQVLVGYASAHGSTRQIAERVGSRLSKAGVAVLVAPVAELEDIGHYDAVVLGSAIHNGAWLPGAMDVVRANSAVLSRTAGVAVQCRDGRRPAPPAAAQGRA